MFLDKTSLLAACHSGYASLCTRARNRTFSSRLVGTGDKSTFRNGQRCWHVPTNGCPGSPVTYWCASCSAPEVSDTKSLTEEVEGCAHGDPTPSSEIVTKVKYGMVVLRGPSAQA